MPAAASAIIYARLSNSGSAFADDDGVGRVGSRLAQAVPELMKHPRRLAVFAAWATVSRPGDTTMKKSASLALAAVLALSGVSAATARSHMSNQTTGASDTLTLSDADRQSIWNDVSKHATNQSAPADFNAAVGSEVPSAINTYPLPRRAARDVPAVKPYRYAMTQDKVLIVNPSDHKIADVVAPSK
jgi:Protein of unknown function (DUF1236)